MDALVTVASLTMLDPASASIAFVGFTASLVTLVAAAVESAQNFHDLWNSTGNTPQEVKGLLRRLKRFQDLLHYLRNGNFKNVTLPQSYATQWKSSIEEMEDDLKTFQGLILQLQKLLSRPAPLQKVQARLRYVLAQKSVAHHQQRLRHHCEQLTLTLSVASQ